MVPLSVMCFFTWWTWTSHLVVCHPQGGVVVVDGSAVDSVEGRGLLALVFPWLDSA